MDVALALGGHRQHTKLLHPRGSKDLAVAGVSAPINSAAAPNDRAASGHRRGKKWWARDPIIAL